MSESSSSTSSASSSSDPLPSVTFPAPPRLKAPIQGMPADQFYLVRGSVIPFISRSELLRQGLQLDSDVHRYGENGEIEKEPVMRNRVRFITNESFKNAEEINQYLRFWGRIPAFMELKPAGEKGYGIFTNMDIQQGTFLGYYEGIHRPLERKYAENVYNFVCNDFDGKPCSVIDAENLTFANWIRYINDGKEPNIEYCVYNLQIYVFSTRFIKAGEEILGSYGEGYWKGMEARGVARMP